MSVEHSGERGDRRHVGKLVDECTPGIATGRNGSSGGGQLDPYLRQQAVEFHLYRSGTEATKLTRHQPPDLDPKDERDHYHGQRPGQ